MVSEELFNDLESGIRKPYPAKKIVRSEYEKFVSDLRSIAEFVEVHSIVEICRDPKDNFLLALTKDGLADYLITGDKDLLSVKQLGKTQIIKLSEIEKMLWE